MCTIPRRNAHWNNPSFYSQQIKLNDTILPGRTAGEEKNCAIRNAGFKKERARCVIRCARARDKNRMHGRYLIVPESPCTYRSCHMPLTPRRITRGGRVYEELSGDRNEVTHTSMCDLIALEIFFPKRTARPGNLRRADPRMTKRIIASGFIGVAPI